MCQTSTPSGNRQFVPLDSSHFARVQARFTATLLSLSWLDGEQPILPGSGAKALEGHPG